MKRPPTTPIRGSFLASLPEAERSRLLASARVMDFNAGTHLIHPGSPFNQIALVEFGMLAVSEVSEHGTGRITVLAGPEALVPVSLLTPVTAETPCEAWALVDSRLLLLDARDVQKWVTEGGPLTVAVLNYLAQLNHRLATDLQITKDFNLVQRTAAALLEISERLPRGSTVERKPLPPNIVPVSHEVLARRLGTVREVATESLGQLREEDLIETLYRRVEIVDAEGLRRRAGGAYRRFVV